MDELWGTHCRDSEESWPHYNSTVLYFVFQEDLWRPVNFQTQDAMDNFEEDMMEFGFLDIHNYTYGV